MKQKLFLLSFPILFLFTFTQAHSVWAADGARLTQAANHLAAVASKAAERQTTELTNIISSADKMITDRITSLNELLTRIQNDSRLSASEKTTLTDQVNTMISNLQALKTKIDADTDVTTARADRKSIVTSYHVYVTFEPQLRLLTIIDNLETTTTNIQNLMPQISTLSATLKSQGKNTTSIDAAIADMNMQLTNINTLLSSDKTTLMSVILTNNNYQATFTQIRQDLAKVRADFAQIRHDMATIGTGVKSLFPKPTTASESAK